MGQSFTQDRAALASEPSVCVNGAGPSDAGESTTVTETGIVSEQQLDAFHLICATMVDQFPESREFSYRPAEQYLSVLCGRPARWFARLTRPKSAPMSVIVPLPVDQTVRLVPDFKVVEPNKGKAEARVYFGSLEALPQLRPVLAAAIQATLGSRSEGN